MSLSSFTDKVWAPLVLIIGCAGLIIGLHYTYQFFSEYQLYPQNPGIYILVVVWTLCYAILEFKSTISTIELEALSHKGGTAPELINSKRKALYVTAIFRIIGVASALFAAYYITAGQISKHEDAKTFEEVTIRYFLNTEANIDGLFKRSQHNIHVVGLTDSFLRSKHADDINQATVDGKYVYFYNYLPRPAEYQAMAEKFINNKVAAADKNAANKIAEDMAVDEYLEVFEKYKPNGEPMTAKLQQWWAMEKDGPPSLAEVVQPNRALYSMSYYSLEPKGWGIFIDVSEDFSSASEIYFFPYLNEAKDQDRPGLHLVSKSKLKDELLDWLKSVRSNSQPPSKGLIDFWRNRVASLDASKPPALK